MNKIEAAFRSAVVYCGLCEQKNWVMDSDALCTRCGLDLERQARLKNERDRAAGVAATPAGDTSSRDPEDSDDTEDVIEQLFDDATLTPRTGTVVLPEFATKKRRPRRAVWAASGAAALLVIGAGVSTAIVLATPAAEQSATPATTVSVQGWTKTPTWELASQASLVSATRAGDFIGLVDNGDAKIVDVATGKVVATRPISDTSTDRMYAAGDTLFVIDGDTVATWQHDATPPTSDTTPGDKKPGDKAKRHDTTAWGEVTLGDTETVSLRGDTLFVVGEVGAAYERVTGDATLTSVAVPIKGAVPVAAGGDTISWATNRGVVYVTDMTGKTVAEQTLAPPTKEATIARWVGGDANYVVVLWDTGDATELVVHTTSGGAIAGSTPLPEDGHDASLLTTRNGGISAFGRLLIDGTTGAITPAGGDVTASVGDALLVDAGKGHLLAHAGSDPEAILAAKGTRVVAELDDVLVVSLGDTLAAVTPSPRGGAQQG